MSACGASCWLQTSCLAVVFLSISCGTSWTRMPLCQWSAHSVFQTARQQCPLFEDEREREPPTRKEIDFVFLLDHPIEPSRMKKDGVIDELDLLLRESKKDCYSDFDIHYALVTYSLQNASTAVLFYDFVQLDMYSGLTSLMKSLPDLESSARLHTELFPLQAVLRTVQMIATVVSNASISVGEAAMRLSHRDNADLHIVVLFDLWDMGTTPSTSDDSGHVSMKQSSLKANLYQEMVQLMGTLHSKSNVAIQFFVNHSNKVATTYIGDPLHSVRYRDCTHFNKALTLKTIITAGEQEANTLQAHLLAKGIEVQVRDALELKDPQCALATNPATWSPYGLHCKFSDKCSKESCSNDESYCSPLHGCVTVDSNTVDLEGDKEKPPLTQEFAFSHGDFIGLQKETSEVNQSMVEEELSITAPALLHSPPFSLSDVVTEQLDTLLWQPDRRFIEELISSRKPTVLKNTVVTTWPATAKWNLTYLSQAIGYDTLDAVKHSNSFLTFDPDERVPLKCTIPLPFVVKNMSVNTFFACIQNDSQCSDEYKGHYYFGKVPTALQPDVMPSDLLYNTEKDNLAQKQFIWISSAGMITHGHFDQDFNIFIQLIGEKRFTLWDFTQHDLMYVYPRVHPLWHKSRINFRDPDLQRFPQFAKSKAIQVTLVPGDILFIPPYTWHYVESLTPSVSLSTWSHDYTLYHHMNAIYRHDHKFDLLEDARGQMFALRLFLDMLIHDLYGFNETTEFFAHLLSTRFSGLEHLFPSSKNDPDICTAAVEGKIPTCIHVHGYAKLDMAIVGSHFEALDPEARDILFQDYVEEITAQVVGVRRMLAFFRYCFLGQDYYITEPGSNEHTLWDHKDT